MRNSIYISLLLPMALSVVGCNNLDEPLDGGNSNSGNSVCFSVMDFEEEDGSRSAIDAAGQFSWTAGDTLGVFPEEGYQTAFPISEGTGTTSALFDGGLWALRPNARYAAYFPFMHPMDKIHRNAIPVSYEGQKQVGNNSTAHLGRYDYIAAPLTDVNEHGGTTFQMNHLGCIVRFNLTMPEADSYDRMTLSTSAGSFATTASFELSPFVATLSPVTTSSAIELALDGLSTTGSNQTLTLYMMLAPGNYNRYALTITMSNATKKYMATVTGKKLEAGKAYQFSATCEPPVANHTYVDLGLPSGTLWANTNVGAYNIEDIGNYFAWAETSTKRSYSWENYYYMNPGYTSWSGCSKYTFADGQTSGSWYNFSGSFVGDNRRELEANDDAATMMWGPEWRTPTAAQIEELLNRAYCTWNWETLNGVKGYRVTSNSNGNSIFLPTGGWFRNTSKDNVTSNGCYWSSSLSSSLCDNAVYLLFHSTSINISYCERANGLTVRPVRVSTGN